MSVDWIILVFAVLTVAGLMQFVRPGRYTMAWLSILTLLFFVFPRAGVLVRQMNMPLPVAHVVASLIVLYWLFYHQPRHRGLHAGYGKFFLIYAAIALLGLIIGLSGGGGLKLALLEIGFYLFTLTIFFYVSESFDQRQHFRAFAYLILLASLGVSLYGIAQHYFGADILIRGLTYNAHTDLAMSYLKTGSLKAQRVLSSYGDPNVLAGQLIVFISIAFALLIGRGMPPHTRLLGGLLLFLNGWCLIATKSRAGWICVIFCVVLLMALRSRWLLLIIPALLLGLMMTGQGMVDTLLVSINPKFATLDGDTRLQYPAVLTQLLQIIPFGCGFGRTVLVFPAGLEWAFEIRSANSVWAGYNSYWMNIICRLGLVGLLSFIALLTALFAAIFRQTRSVEEPYIRSVLTGATVGMIGQFIIWMANNTYFLPGGGLNFWFMMGMLMAGSRAFARPSLSAGSIPWWRNDWAPAIAPMPAT